MADIVWKDYPVSAEVERLARPIKFIRELGAQELLSASTRAVQDHHRIVDFALGISMGLTERRVVNAKARQALATLETEVVNDKVGFLNGPSRGRIRRGSRGCRLRHGRSSLRGRRSLRRKSSEKVNQKVHLFVVACFRHKTKLIDAVAIYGRR
jgi:hypothetical protein